MGSTNNGRFAYYLVSVVSIVVTVLVSSRSPAWSVEIGIVLAGIMAAVIVGVDMVNRHLRPGW